MDYISIIYDIPLDITLVFQAIGLGSVLSDLLALVRPDSRVADIELPSSIQETRNNPQDKLTDAANNFEATKPQRVTKEETLPLQKEYQDIIAGAAPNVHDPRQARAIPNQRLDVAFHVNNCFTNGTAQRCQDFRREIEKLLSPEGDHEAH